ncbi:MAG TPA: hypothetical protein VHN77_02415 [Phycisphaerales bacterium]|nr:hypothetical protein [Phycisphaerales bacterium]
MPLRHSESEAAARPWRPWCCAVAVMAAAGLCAAAETPAPAGGPRPAPAKRVVIGDRADGEHQVAKARVAAAHSRGSTAQHNHAEQREEATVAGTAQVIAHSLTGGSNRGLSRMKPQVLVRARDSYRADITVEGVALGAGFVLREFVSAERVRNVSFDGPADAVRLVRGPATTVPTPPRTLGQFDDAPGLLSREDLTRAASALASAATSPNLNQCVDVDRACDFSFDIVFDQALVDNNAGADPLPELLFFERSGGRGGEAITVQALDAHGEEVGRALVLGADAGTDCTPRADAAVLDRRLQVAGFESVTFIAVDLSVLGVTQATTLRVRTPRPGDETPDRTAWGGDAGLPDFKLLGVKTDATLPAWMIGD